MDINYVIGKFLLVTVLFAISLVIAMYSTYAERKVAAFLQDRLGPDRAGPFGLLQPMADGLKMFMKEEIIPTVSNKYLFILGPSLAMLTALMAGVVIPWGGNITIGDNVFPMQITDINIGAFKTDDHFFILFCKSNYRVLLARVFHCCNC